MKRAIERIIAGKKLKKTQLAKMSSLDVYATQFAYSIEMNCPDNVERERALETLKAATSLAAMSVLYDQEEKE